VPNTVLNVAAKQALPSGAVTRAADYLPHLEPNVGSTERLVSLGLGTCLTVFGITGRRVSPLALAAGGFLLYRGLSGNCPLYQALGTGTGGTSGQAAVMPARAGVKFVDADLIGCPVQVLVGAKGLARGVVEVKVRATGARREVEPQKLVQTLPL